MPEGVGYSGSNVIVGTGLELNYINNFVYAYSGQIGVAQSPVAVLLNFTSGSDLAICKFQFTMGEDTTDNIVWEILLNEIIVSGSLNEAAQMGNPLQPLRITLPPYTKVLVRATNFTQDVARKCYAVVQGKIYK